MTTCPTCNGRGIYDSYDAAGRAFEIECYKCDGRGTLDGQGVEVPPRAQEVGNEIAAHLDLIKRLFKPGAKVTLIVNNGNDPDRAMVVGDDELEDVRALLVKLEARGVNGFAKANERN